MEERGLKLQNLSVRTLWMTFKKQQIRDTKSENNFFKKSLQKQKARDRMMEPLLEKSVQRLTDP